MLSPKREALIAADGTETWLLPSSSNPDLTKLAGANDTFELHPLLISNESRCTN